MKSNHKVIKSNQNICSEKKKKPSKYAAFKRSKIVY